MNKELDTHALQILLHSQDDTSSGNNERFAAFINELRLLAEKHGVILDKYESFTLRGNDYNVGACQQCGKLTIEDKHIEEGIENLVPYFWEFVKKGEVVNGVFLCRSCQIHRGIT